MNTMKSVLISLLLSLSLASAAEKPIIAIYDLQGPLSESGQSSSSLLSLDFETSRPLTFFDVTRSLEKAAADPLVKALVLDVDDSPLSLSQLQEIRHHLLAARDGGKDVWIYSDHFQNRSALLGSAANHFVLMPEADVLFSGIHSESLYFKGLLDKVGVAADVIHIGDFKSYGEEFYRTGPSDFAKKQRKELIDGTFDQIIDGIADGRKIPREKVLELVDRGTFTAKDAMEAGLVDELDYRTEFNRKLRKLYAEAKFDREYELPDLDGPKIDGLFDLFKLMLTSGRDTKSRKDFVAVVTLEGSISEKSIAPVRKEILSLIKNPRAKALVLRVDSPGGSALASEVLWEATDEWNSTGRPFVVSMGGVAASGGYYVSAGAERIFAQPSTITGSIGVVGMKLVTAGALEKLGITTHSIQRGKFADSMSMNKPFSPAQAEIVRESMLQVYGTFKKRIIDGRGAQLKGELEGMAGGRVYTGTRALELGLVDELGGLSDAIAWAAKKSGVEDGAAQLKPEPKSAIEGIFASPDKKKDDEIVSMGQQPSTAGDAIRSMIREAGMPALPAPMRASLSRALERLDAISESQIQLISPELQICW